MALPDDWLKLPKWEKLKLWLADNHDNDEKRHLKTLLGADAAEMGVYRKVIDAMSDIEIQEQSIAKQNAGDVVAARRRRGSK